jgi:hypothetical protein
MHVLKLAMWAMLWTALGYLWRERVAYRTPLRPAQLAAVRPPPLALLPPPEVIDLPGLALPRPQVPEDVHATEEMTISRPSAAPAPIARQGIRARNAQWQAHRHRRTVGVVLAVIVTGAAIGAVAGWMLSAVPGLL